MVYLETTKANYKRGFSLDSVKSDLVATDLTEEAAAKEQRLACLDDCLRVLPSESSELILEYYRYEESGQIERRRSLAARLGLRRDALANRVQRMRDKLEQCVSHCLRKKSAI